MIRGNLSESDLLQLERNMEPRVGGSGATAPKKRLGQSVAGPRRVAGESPAPPPSKSKPYAPYSSKWELQYSKVLDMELKVGAIKSWQYEGITFTLSNVQYHRIDFIIGHNDRSIEIAQVKGWHPNLRAGIKGLKWAAQKYPMFTWTMKWWTGTGWDGSYVEI